MIEQLILPILAITILLVIILFPTSRRRIQSGAGRRFRKEPSPRRRGGGTTAGSYGYDVSYSPGWLGSTSGPFPVGGRTKRKKTETFRQHSEDE
ncbi:MAG: hypothetical protein ACW99U_07535 [Candidatus Thorarchaeota archaeon]